MRKKTRIEKLPAFFEERKWRSMHLSLALSLAFAFALPPTHAQTDERSGAQIVAAQCVKCHGEGLNGAPKIGDREAWGQRIAKNVGFDNLVRSAIRGYGGMPARGEQANLTDSELRSAIEFMYNPAVAGANPILEIARPVGAGPFPSRWSGGGMDFYLGFMPAQNLLQLPKGSPERTMHGGVPSGTGYYHVNVSLFNGMTRAPINDAQIKMQLEQRGRTGIETKLEPMSIGVGSYGNFIKPQPDTSYLITLHIARPGAAGDVEAKFEHRFE